MDPLPADEIIKEILFVCTLSINENVYIRKGWVEEYKRSVYTHLLRGILYFGKCFQGSYKLMNFVRQKVQA